MAVRLVPRVCAAVFVAGIAGLIVASIAGNNNGLVLSIGGVTAVAAIVLITFSAISHRSRIDVFDDVAAERLEGRIAELVHAGTDEDELRSLVREAMRLGRP